MSEQRRVSADVVVVGGGIVGGASAYYLAKRGVRVVLMEKGVVGGEASGRNGGGVRQQCRDRRERGLAMASVKLWEGIQAELGFDMEYAQDGNIRMATNDARMDALRAEGEEELADGLAVEIWDRETLRKRAPYLGDVFIGAKYCATDGIANPILSSRAFGWAAKRIGVTILDHTEAVEVRMDGGQVSGGLGRDAGGEIRVEAPMVIHAGGPWSPHLSKTLGITLPIVPKRATVVVTQRVPFLFKEFVSSHDLNFYARPAKAGQIHVGGIDVPAETFDKSATVEILAKIAQGVALGIPALKGASFLRMWSGTLAMTPDKVPVIGPVPGVEGYLLAAGFSGHGFCLGPIAGKLMSEMVLDGGASMDLGAFGVGRFG